MWAPMVGLGKFGYVLLRVVYEFVREINLFCFNFVSFILFLIVFKIAWDITFNFSVRPEKDSEIFAIIFRQHLMVLCSLKIVIFSCSPFFFYIISF